jgi:uncharacterized membrane protein YjjP (DUF1212 family)
VQGLNDKISNSSTGLVKQQQTNIVKLQRQEKNNSRMYIIVMTLFSSQFFALMKANGSIRSVSFPEKTRHTVSLFQSSSA